MANLDRSAFLSSGLAAVQRPGMTPFCRGLALKSAAAFLLLMLAGCHGSPNDVMFPGTLGHDPPPAINLPPQDAGMEYR